jgi:hypothetical protein
MSGREGRQASASDSVCKGYLVTVLVPSIDCVLLMFDRESGRKYDWKGYLLEGSIGGRDSLSESASGSVRKGERLLVIQVHWQERLLACSFVS